MESKFLNKGFAFSLSSLRMKSDGFHGNDSRHCVYDVYTVVDESKEGTNPFMESFLAKRRSTLSEATWLPPDQFFVQVSEPGQAQTPGTMSLERRAQQLLGGEDVPLKLLESATHGCENNPKSFIQSPNDRVHVCHLTPFEGCLEKVVLRLNLTAVGTWRVFSGSTDILATNTCQGRMGRILLDDWRTSTWKYMPAQQLKFLTDLPEQEAKRHLDPPPPEGLQVIRLVDGQPAVGQDFRKKWLHDVAYGPEWSTEMKKFDELLATHLSGQAAADATTCEASSGAGEAAAEQGATELPPAWMPMKLEKIIEGHTGEQVRFASHLDAFEFLALLPQQPGADASLYLLAKETSGVPLKEALLHHGSADWIKPPKSTRLLSNPEEKHVHTFELRDDLSKAG